METGRAQEFGPESGTSTLPTTTANTADQAAMAAGEKLRVAADMIREKAPQEGTIGATATAVAESFDEAGLYLQEQGFTGAREDVELLIRRYPIQSLLLGLGVGYLLARMRAR
ncbi:MAG: hypothetical protein ACREJU_07100 [Nitrospiraceae bacterium]